MNQIILNEKEYAEECLRKRPLGQPSFQTLSILARYFYHVKGYRKKKIITELTNYIQSAYSIFEFDKAKWEDTIDKLAANASKFKLHQINGVHITEHEMDTIDSIDSKVLRRLAFTMLCLAKLGNERNPNNNGWVRMDAKDIFKLARISCGIDDRDEKLSQLYQRGLLEFPKRNDNMDCRVTFIDDHSTEKLFVDDFRELGYEYLFSHGENFIRCRECGILTRGNKNGTKKYCSQCAAPSPINTKLVVCVDCGDEFEIDSKNNRTNRCPHCYAQYRQAQKNKEQQIRRNTNKLKSEQI